MDNRHIRACAAVLVAMTVGVAAPRAEAAPEDPRPWAAGVSPEAQEKAFLVFDEANRLFEQSRHSLALEKYKEAMNIWNHPNIHFNVAVCLISLDQPLAAYEHLKKAIAYGPDPLGPNLYSQALTYEKLLAGRLSRVEVRCAQPNVDVLLDGRPLFTGPGSATRTLMPGPHQLVARKRDHLTDARTLTLVAGKDHVETIELKSVEEVTRYEQRWSTWVPWAVLGSGAAVTALGIGLQALSGADFNEYDRQVAKACPEGCKKDEVPGSVGAIKDRAQAENVAAIVSFATGGAVAALGGILLILNQPRPVVSKERARLAPPPAIPTVTRGGAGIEIRLSF